MPPLLPLLLLAQTKEKREEMRERRKRRNMKGRKLVALRNSRRHQEQSKQKQKQKQNQQRQLPSRRCGPRTGGAAARPTRTPSAASASAPIALTNASPLANVPVRNRAWIALSNLRQSGTFA